MRKCLLLLLSAIYVFSSCKKLGICHDTEFSVKKADFSGAELRTDGYYYGDAKDDGQGGTLYSIVIFYRNGIVYMPGASEKKKMDTYVSELKGDHIKNVKYDWGYFSIAGNEIKMERWPPTLHGCNN